MKDKLKTTVVNIGEVVAYITNLDEGGHIQTMFDKGHITCVFCPHPFIYSKVEI